MKYFANQCGTPYIVCISKNIGEREITKAEYDKLLNLALNAPKALGGYEYKLRADNLEWELVKLPEPEPEPVEEEAGPEDYEQALEEMGVDFSD